MASELYPGVSLSYILKGSELYPYVDSSYILGGFELYLWVIGAIYLKHSIGGFEDDTNDRGCGQWCGG